MAEEEPSDREVLFTGASTKGDFYVSCVWMHEKNIFLVSGSVPLVKGMT